VDDPAADGMTTTPPPLQLRELSVREIEPNLSQPRRYFDETALQALADSIGERGVLQPVLVRPSADGKYQLVAGERRWRAAKLAGLETIPALLSPYDDGAALEVALIENMAREDLNPVEEARACATLVKELGLTIEQVGQRVGRSRVAVSNLMRLLGLSAEILELIERGELSEGHGRALLTAKDHESRRELARQTIEKGWSVRVLEDRARESNSTDSVPKSPGSASDSAVPMQRQGHGQQRRDLDTTAFGQQGQDLDMVAFNVAKVWGDVLGVEVGVRTLRGRQLRVEVVFNSPEAALAAGGHLAEQVARGNKRR
jgi:ParB family chromosome partitioning protein